MNDEQLKKASALANEIKTEVDILIFWGEITWERCEELKEKIFNLRVIITGLQSELRRNKRE